MGLLNSATFHPEFFWFYDETGEVVTDEKNTLQMRSLGGHWKLQLHIPGFDGVSSLQPIPSCEVYDAGFPDAPTNGAWLARVFVPEPLRGKGIGRMMVKEVIRWCREQKKEGIGLSCLMENKVAYGLYQSLGFFCVCFGKGTDRYFMAKDLRNDD